MAVDDGESAAAAAQRRALVEVKRSSDWRMDGMVVSEVTHGG
jgi:hypothetical protein